MGSDTAVVDTADEIDDAGGLAADEEFDASDVSAADESGDDAAPKIQRVGHHRVRRALAALLVVLIVLCAGGVGYLWWQGHQRNATERARAQATSAAKESTVALLSYEPDSAQQKLTAARDLLTGTFRDSYTSLTNDVVIPAALDRHVSAVANVPAVAVLSADPRRAVAMVFVDQTTIIGSDAPTATSSVVKVTLDRVDNRWLVSGFDPM